MEKTNLSENHEFYESNDDNKTLNSAPGSIDLRQRVPDLLFCIGMDTNKHLRDSGFTDEQIISIYRAIRLSPCFISINFNVEPLDLPNK